ncbi:MAG: circularly permuted type 2 ATP-grasp protein [Ilumatobacteraceae bacterium]
MTSTHTPVGGGPLRPPEALHERLMDPLEVPLRQARADRLLAAEGAGHLVHDLPVRADGRFAGIESRPWRVDPIPVVLDASTFRWLSIAVAERMDALDAVLADLYGQRLLVSEQVVRGEVLASTKRYRVNAVGSTPRRWLSTYAVDVAVDANGAWWVVQDLTDAPPGLGYAMLDRSVMARVVPDIAADAEIASLARFPAALRRSLAAASGASSPRIVLFSAGLDHPSYVDHSYLAVQLGINLVEGADLVVRQRSVWLRTLDGLEPVDVLYRRLEDPMIDPLGIAPSGSVGVPGLLQAVRAGGVTLANANGSGVLEVEAVADVVDDAIARIRPTDQLLSRLRDHSRPLMSVPLAPTIAAPGQGEAAVVIRLFAVHDGRSVQVMPGGTARVLAAGDDPRWPTACVAKDVWVLGHTVAPVVGPALPQVDFGRSVPTRAADALYWTNRAAERAEAMARTMRVISSRLEQDLGLAGLHGGEWTQRMQFVASGVRRRRRTDDRIDDRTEATLDGLRDELSLVGDAVANEIGSLLTEATTVREYLSVTTGRVLAHLAELRSSLQQRMTVIDDLDAVLADFAALAGLWQESTVRGPAWRIGDTGRRLERCLVILDLIEGAMRRSPDPDARRAAEIDGAAIEVLLAANDSLVAYRRRHRSDVEVEAAIRLLVTDYNNPRSLAASIDRLEQHAVDGEPAVGGAFVMRARRALTLPTAEMLVEMRAVIDEAGALVVSRWFSTPVNPIILSATGRSA